MNFVRIEKKQVVIIIKMATTLATIQPKLPTSATFNYFTCTACTGNKFGYYLDSDWTTWQTWAYQVDEPSIYDVPYKTAQNREKFSAFILVTSCTTAAEGDACIFKSKQNGMLGFFSDGAGALETFRCTETQFKTYITDATFNTDQKTTYFSNLDTNCKVDTASALVNQEYMDYAKCEAITGAI